ncbi:MAG: GNAT family N-acetyltransferase [Candidatus Sericytochromatia bacterium]|nr:GNAT family N-acetyltransferase [Candidatus Sericytochromatia bacterium]
MSASSGAPQGPSVRRAGVLDLPGVRDLLARVAEPEGSGSGLPALEAGLWPRSGDPVQQVLEWLPRPDRQAGHLWVAVREGLVLGVARTLPGNRARTRWHIEGMVMRQDMRGLGLGGALMDRIIGFYGERGAVAVTLHCDVRHDGLLGLSRSRGFRSYARVTCLEASQETVRQAEPMAPPLGWRPARTADRPAILELERITTPAPVRCIDSRRPEAFGKVADVGIPGLLQAPWRDVENLAFVVEDPLHGIVAHLQVMARLRGEGPHLMHLTVHPGHVPLYGDIMAHAMGRLRGYPNAPARLAVASHHPAKRQACLDSGMGPVREEVCLVRDGMRTLVIPRAEAAPRQVGSLAPAFRMQAVKRG